MRRLLLFLTFSTLCFGVVNAQKVGDSFLDNEIGYRVTNVDPLEVAMVAKGPNIKYSGDIVIPQSVQNGGNTFAVTSIDLRAFYNCSGLTSVNIPSSVTAIGNHAFFGCSSLTSITIPNGVTVIEQSTFSGCTSLATINLPNSIVSIDLNAFEGTKWYSDLADGVVYINNILYAYKGTMPENTEIVVNNGTATIAKDAFKNCANLTSITIPNSVTTIGESAFEGCTGLTTVDIPNSITTYNSSVFNGCTSLTSITIPEGVTSIGGSTFYGCSNLAYVTLPQSILSLGTYAFYGCGNIKKITCYAKQVPTINLNVFSTRADIFDTLLVPVKSKEAYEGTQRLIQFSGKVFGLCEVKVESINNSYGTANSDKALVVENKTATLTATPAVGYHFTRWSDGNTSNPRAITVVSDTTLTAEFDINVYNVTAIAENGTVTGATKYGHGAVATLSATANNGYHFTQWSDGEKNSTRTITVTSNITFTALFAPNVYNITTSATNGSITGGGEHNYGSNVTLTATAANGYHFTQWSDGVKDNPRSITVTSDITLSAEFASDAEQNNQEEGENNSGENQEGNENNGNGETNNQEGDKNNDVAISENEASKLLVYPSPATSVITIGGVEANSLVKVYNINGVIVVATMLDGNSLNVSNLAKGTYIVETENGATARFVKQ